jgi:glycosyltransferase involved in cell wall biosynthesis
MKILQVIQRFPPAVGGGEEVVFQLSKNLIKRGHEVTVATSNWLLDNDVPGISSSRINLKYPRHPLPAIENKDGIEILRFRPWFRLWSYTINLGLASFLLRHADDYDLIHAHYYMFTESDLAVLAALLKKRPSVLTHHRSLEMVNSLGPGYRFARGIYDRTLGRITLNSLSKLIVLTESMKNEFELMGVPSEKLKVIPNGVDLERFYSKEVPGAYFAKLGYPERVVLFVGRLESVKGPQFVIEAALQILNEFPNTKFIFVGEDWGYGKKLQKIASRLNIADQLLFVGRVSEEELIYFYNLANALVFPSIGEGFGMVAVESIACGTPTVLANADGLKDILNQIGGYGLDMSQNIADQIAKGVIDIFMNSNINEEMKAQRLKLEEHFSWPVIAHITENTYLEAIKG